MKVADMIAQIQKQKQEQDEHGKKNVNTLGQQTYKILIPGFGFESCKYAKEQRSLENEIKIKKRTKAEEENMIHQNFIKSANSYKIKEQKLFKKMEERLDEELLKQKITMKGIEEEGETPTELSEEHVSP